MSCTDNCNQGRACTCDTSPHTESIRDLVDFAIDAAFVLAILGSLVFVVFALAGFWSAS